MTLLFHTHLDGATQRAQGITNTAPLAMADKVRFSELDVLNHVNNAVYLSWFESARVRYISDAGMNRSMGQGNGPRIVMRSGSIHYRQEMKLDEVYVVTCRCIEFRTTSFTMSQELWSGGSLRATFECVLVLLSPDGPDRYPIPDKLRALFKERDGASQA